MRRTTTVAGAMAAIAAMAAGCSTHDAGAPTASSSAASATSPTQSAQAGSSCSLPHFGDLVEWRHQPGKTDRAFRVSDVDKKSCQPTLNNWSADLPEAPGVCYMIGWAADNAGYNVSAIPAPPLIKAFDKIGDAC